MQLSQNFSLAECMASDTAARNHIDNTPSPAAIKGMTKLCLLVLEPVRAHFGPVRINSMFRCHEVNRLVGSSDTSQHIASENWAAVDFTVRTATPLEVCRWVAGAGLPHDQLIHEFGAWTHCSWSVAPRGQLLTIDREGKRPGLWPAR